MNFVQPIRDVEKVREVRSFLAAKNPRDDLMFCFGIYTGLRISDILQFKVGDVREKNFLLVKEQKIQKTRKVNKTKRVPVMPELKKTIAVYIANRPDNEYLFKSRQGRNSPITRVRAYDILREAAHACNIDEIGTHTLRKTFGYHIYQATKDVALLQDILNHSAPYITMKYIGVNQDAIENAYKMLRF